MFRVFIASTAEARPYASVVADELESTGLFTAMRWWLVFRPNETIYQQIIKLVGQVDFGLFVTTPDDIVQSRDREYATARGNVVLEYGIFTGRLGHTNTVRVHVGRIAESPSDLYGLHDLHASVTYEPHGVPSEADCAVLRAVGQGAADLFLGATAATGHNPASALNGVPIKRDILRKAVRDLEAAQQRLRFTRLMRTPAGHGMAADILKKWTTHDVHAVGLPSSSSTTRAFVDFEAMGRVPTEQDLLARAFADFVARQVSAFAPHTAASRFAIHDQRNQLGFLSKVLSGLGAKPTIVRLNPEGDVRSIGGNFLPPERAVFLQPVTSQGFIPYCCARALEQNDITPVALFSLVAKQEHLGEIQSYCAEHRMLFRPMFVQDPNGGIELAECV